MSSMEAQGSDGSTPDFKFVLESHLTPSQSGHRRVRSRERSLDRRIMMAIHHESSPGPDYGQEDFKALDVELNVENDILQPGIAIEAIKVIDDCKSLEIGQNVELPRLVLIGDSSSGKSSLLENLTGVPFATTTCQGTRFPIELRMTKDIDKYEIKSSIITKGIFTNLDAKKLQEFNGRKQLTQPITKKEFIELLCEASIILDVPPPFSASEPVQDMSPGTRFKMSPHCLQIEIRGPNLTSLSIIDTPGLHHASDDLQEVGLAMEVQTLVEELAKDEKNILVCVMTASQQVKKPRIFQIAERFDPSSDRTLGVLTKCDCIFDGESDAFQAVLKTAQNTKFPLKHGWYVIKNRSCSEALKGMSLEEARRRESTLFSGIPWHPVTSHLEEGRMGIRALRKGLSDMYRDQIHAELPVLIQKARKRLAIKKAEIKTAREDFSNIQRSYLGYIVDEYKSWADECLKNIQIEVVEEDDENLMMHLEKCRQTMGNDLSLRGTTRAFHSVIEGGDLSSAIAAGSRRAGDLADEFNIYTWINERYQSNTGGKIPGCIPQSFIIELFSEQMDPWESIIQNFINAVSQAFRKPISAFIQRMKDKDMILHRLEELVQKALDSKLGNLQQECLARSRYDPSQLLQLEVDKRALEKEVREARMKRLKSVVTWMASPSRLSNTEKLEEYLSCDQHIVFQVHDTLKALYNLAARDYTSWIKTSLLSLDFIKETMDVCNNKLFDAMTDEEIGGLFELDAKTNVEKALEEETEKLETLLQDLEHIEEKSSTLAAGEKALDTDAGNSTKIPIRMIQAKESMK